MRIISGVARGLKLKSPPGATKDIRPTSDRCREALFSILQQKVQDASVLDLFAGTGALGLEALSRGACAAHFVDISPKAIALIKCNANAFMSCLSASAGHSMPHISVTQRNLSHELSFLGKSRDTPGYCYDIIFVDPPYSHGFSGKILQHLDTGTYLKKGGLLVIEESSQELLPTDLSTLVCTDKRSYGDTSFWFFETSLP